MFESGVGVFELAFKVVGGFRQANAILSSPTRFRGSRVWMVERSE